MTNELHTVGTDPVEEFLSHAVLRYSPDDGPARWAVAGRLLAADPHLGPANVYTACATADRAAVQRFLAADRNLAGRPGGPLNWEPLLYLAYARHDPDVPLLDVLSTAEFLLQAGADPNAGFLLPDEATPFTALTGAMGSGELGSNDQPGHPHGPALARLLLTAGADANDGQALYNRMFEPQNDHLQLLFEFGLGAGDGGPWHRRFPSTTDDPSSMLADQLSWAVCHGMAERVRLLAAHGVDLGPLGGRLAATGVGTMIELAQISGHPEIADLLIGVGAPSTHVAPVVQLAAALLAGDAERVRALTESDPTLLPMLRAQRPALVLRAVGTGSAPGVELVLRNGFDINAYGRQDVPIEQPWETALHCAAGAGELELVQLLLRAGADPNLVDKRFGTTPLGWTEHFGRTELTETLRPVTGAPAPS